MTNITRVARRYTKPREERIPFCTWDEQLRRNVITPAAFNWLNLHSLVSWYHDIQWRARLHASTADNENIVTILVVSMQRDYFNKELTTQQKLGYGISIQPHDTIESVTATCKELGWI